MILVASDPSILVIFLASKIQPEFQCAFSWNIMDFWWKLVIKMVSKSMKNKAPTKKTWKAKNLEKPLFFLCFLEIWTLKISLKITIFTTKSYPINCLDSIHEFKYLLAQFSSFLDTIFTPWGILLVSWWLPGASLCLSWPYHLLFLAKSGKLEATKVSPVAFWSEI